MTAEEKDKSNQKHHCINTRQQTIEAGLRMAQNYLHGAKSPQINAFLAAAGWKMKEMMRKLSKNAKSFIFRLSVFYLTSNCTNI